MIAAAKLFLVQPQESYLFWALRAYISMPIPDFWTKEFNHATDSYIYKDLQTNSRLSVHPCYNWIKELIQFLRKQYKEHRGESMIVSSKMIFRDQLQRNYESDIGLMIREARDGTKSRPLANYLNISANSSNNYEAILRTRHETNPSNRSLLSSSVKEPYCFL